MNILPFRKRTRSDTWLMSFDIVRTADGTVIALMSGLAPVATKRADESDDDFHNRVTQTLIDAGNNNKRAMEQSHG